MERNLPGTLALLLRRKKVTGVDSCRKGRPAERDPLSDARAEGRSGPQQQPPVVEDNNITERDFLAGRHVRIPNAKGKESSRHRDPKPAMGKTVNSPSNNLKPLANYTKLSPILGDCQPF